MLIFYSCFSDEILKGSPDPFRGESDPTLNFSGVIESIIKLSFKIQYRCMSDPTLSHNDFKN